MLALLEGWGVGRFLGFVRVVRVNDEERVARTEGKTHQ